MRKKLVVFSGAGMSAESGISTFRDSGGLWEKYKIEDVATPEAWRNNPDLVTDFYNQRRKQIIKAQPNEAHVIIKDLEKNFEVFVVTQNIDDLHERAGSSNVIHLHGNIRFAKSSGPQPEKEYFQIKGWELKPSDACPDGYRLRPHVVWFGEDVPMFNVAAEIIKNVDIMVVIGTSLQVYPAAGLIHYCKKECKKWIIDPSLDDIHLSTDFNKIYKKAGDGMKELKKILMD
jgi:NAD-dependent deacetylase